MGSPSHPLALCNRSPPPRGSVNKSRCSIFPAASTGDFFWRGGCCGIPPSPGVGGCRRRHDTTEMGKGWGWGGEEVPERWPAAMAAILGPGGGLGPGAGPPRRWGEGVGAALPGTGAYTHTHPPPPFRDGVALDHVPAGPGRHVGRERGGYGGRVGPKFPRGGVCVCGGGVCEGGVAAVVFCPPTPRAAGGTRMSRLGDPLKAPRGEARRFAIGEAARQS